MKRLDDVNAYPDSALAEVEAQFRRGLVNSVAVFGSYAFRRWPVGNDRKNPLNKALFETWTVALCDLDEADVRTRAAKIQNDAQLAMTLDRELIQAISVSTGDRRRVRYRFDVAKRIARGDG
jgi:hypothetical protein